MAQAGRRGAGSGAWCYGADTLAEMEQMQGYDGGRTAESGTLVYRARGGSADAHLEAWGATTCTERGARFAQVERTHVNTIYGSTLQPPRPTANCIAATNHPSAPHRRPPPGTRNPPPTRPSATTAQYPDAATYRPQARSPMKTPARTLQMYPTLYDMTASTLSAHQQSRTRGQTRRRHSHEDVDGDDGGEDGGPGHVTAQAAEGVDSDLVLGVEVEVEVVAREDEIGAGVVVLALPRHHQRMLRRRQEPHAEAQRDQQDADADVAARTLWDQRAAVQRRRRRPREAVGEARRRAVVKGGGVPAEVLVVGGHVHCARSVRARVSDVVPLWARCLG